MKTQLENLLYLLDHPQKWKASDDSIVLVGMERPQVFFAPNPEALKDVLAALSEIKSKNVAVLGFNPTGFMAAFQLKQSGYRVSLLFSGVESPEVITSAKTTGVADFFAKSGLVFWPHPAKALRGSQIHCQSGYCSFVCEGRFIEESDAVGRVLTDGGNVYADIVLIAGG